MKIIIGILGFFRLKGLVKLVLNFLLSKKDDLLWRYAIFPVVTLGAPGFIATYYSNARVTKWLVEEAAWAANALNNYPVHAVVISGILVYSYSILDPLLDFYAKRFQPFKSSPLTVLQKTLEILVDAKYQRFKAYLHSISDNHVERRDTFATITKPGEQLRVLTYAVYEFFNRTEPDVEFKVRIVKVEKDQPVEWLTYEPREAHPRTSINTLQDKGSTICRCIDARNIQVVEDIKFSNEFMRTRSDDVEDIGSVLCYPVIIDTDVSYVISISASKPNFFVKRQIRYYKWLMGQYSLRLMLEHTLASIQERVNGEH